MSYHKVGGARKNRVAHETRVLPAGRYAALSALDDSHDTREWNAAPPFDPSFWGLTVRVKPEDRANVTTVAYDPTPAEQAIVALTRMRDSETRTQGFTLTRPMDVRVYALGEGSENGMNDYGWILDAATRKRVWVMDYDRTEHAGECGLFFQSARKNRAEAFPCVFAELRIGNGRLDDCVDAPSCQPEVEPGRRQKSLERRQGSGVR